MELTMKVVVPKDETTRKAYGILPGSGVVECFDVLSGRDLVYFEGNKYNAVNLQAFDEKVACAADRAFTDYPTTAKRVVRAEGDFIPVGSYQVMPVRKLVLDEEAKTLQDWLNGSQSGG